MSARLLALLLVLAGCPSDDDTTDVDTDDTDTEDTDDTDSDSLEDTGDSFSGWDTFDTAPDTDTDTDTDTGWPDTAGCGFGEVADCEGNCFPTYFIGDGYCDDGDPLPADFNCETFAFDRGDCNLDTGMDTGDPTDGCPYIVEITTVNWAQEMGWRIEGSGGVLYSIAPGTVIENNGRTYSFPVTLSDGSYTFVAEDSFGDGWHSGSAVVRDAYTGAIVMNFQPGSAGGWSIQTRPFTTDCSGLTRCDVQIDAISTAAGDEMGWDLYTAFGAFVASRSPGAFPDDTRTSVVLDLPGGAAGSNSPVQYRLRLRDTTPADGWQGGYAEARAGDGYLYNTLAVPAGATTVEVLFDHDCAYEAIPAADAPSGVLTPARCDNLEWRFRTGTGVPRAARDAGFAIFRMDDWSLTMAENPGSFQTNETTYTGPIPELQSGLYFVRQLEYSSDRDGWNGGRLDLVDLSDGSILETMRLPDGPTTGKYFEIDCPVIVDTGDTGDTGDTDTDTDLPEPECLPGAIEDCDGVCWPQTYLGDGVCDDGGPFAPDFACTDLGFDAGDCPQP